MQSIHKVEMTLSLQADLIFLPVATSFVEKAAAAFGLAEPEALSLTLATEEIFVYLSSAAVGKDIVLKCRSGGYYVDQEFLFEARDFNMKAFNLTASVSMDHQDSMDETGLLIASRMVDRFQFFEEGKALRLILTKDKSYPSIDDFPASDTKPLESYSIRPPDTEELKLFVSLAQKRYASPVTPQSFNFPGKVADMVACGEYRSAIAADQAGRIGGGIVWRWDGIRLVELYGPYVLGAHQDSAMSQALIDCCLSNVARIGAVGLICRYPTPELPAEYFERLGSLIFRNEQNAFLELTSYYRHLEEDLGLSVWSHDSIEPFLVRYI